MRTFPASDGMTNPPRETILFLPAALAVTVVVFAIVPEGFNFTWDELSGGRDAARSSMLRRVHWLPILGLSGLMILYRLREALQLARSLNPFLYAFIIWAALTWLWSPVPSATLRKLVLLGGGVAIAVAVHLNYRDPYDLLRWLRTGVTIILLASIPMSLLLPGYGISGGQDNSWVGITQSKNHLGQAAGLGLLLWLHAGLAGLTTWGRAVPGVVLSLAFLVLAGSASSVACALLGVMVLVPIMRPPLGSWGSVAEAALAATAVLVLGAHFYIVAFGVPTLPQIITPIADLLGRDVTLTGRSDMWMLLMTEVRQHWWIGHGYGAFWLGEQGPAAWVARALYWLPWQAHNGYLDVLNETGLVGLGLASLFFLWHAIQSLRITWHDRHLGAFHLALLAFILLNNVSESSMFRTMQFLFIISIFSSVALSRALLTTRRPHTLPTARRLHRGAEAA